MDFQTLAAVAAVATVLVSLISGVFGWLFATKRTQWDVQGINSKFAAIEARVSHVETQGQMGAQALAGISATLGAIQETLREIKSELRGKADKP